MATWRVIERKLRYNRQDRIWTHTERVIATGLTQQAADALLERGGVDYCAEQEAIPSRQG